MPSDRALAPGQLAQFGASARERRIAALCEAADGRRLALTGRDLAGATVERGKVLNAWELIEAAEVDGSAAADAGLIPVDLLRRWDDSVYRTMVDGTRVHGVLAGVRGLTRIRCGPGHVHVRGLLEIEFDRLRPDLREQPALASTDLGALVSVVTGQACAVLVAGAGRTGFAVPLSEALTQLRLSLLALPPHESKLQPESKDFDLLHQAELGIEAMASDVLRGIEIDLGERPLLEAA